MVIVYVCVCVCFAIVRLAVFSIEGRNMFPGFSRVYYYVLLSK